MVPSKCAGAELWSYSSWIWLQVVAILCEGESILETLWCPRFDLPSSCCHIPSHVLKHRLVLLLESYFGRFCEFKDWGGSGSNHFPVFLSLTFFVTSYSASTKRYWQYFVWILGRLIPFLWSCQKHPAGAQMAWLLPLSASQVLRHGQLLSFPSVWNPLFKPFWCYGTFSEVILIEPGGSCAGAAGSRFQGQVDVLHWVDLAEANPSWPKHL